MQNGLAHTDAVGPTVLRSGRRGRNQWKSQVWLKACNRRDEAEDMVGVLGAMPPPVAAAAVCAHGSSNLSTVGDCESGNRLCEVVQS